MIRYFLATCASVLFAGWMTGHCFDYITPDNCGILLPAWFLATVSCSVGLWCLISYVRLPGSQNGRS